MSDTEPTTYTGKTIVGLTGNIATGKSAVMRLAYDHGALTIDADKIVHELMDNDATMQAAIAVAFGSEVRREDGRINRKTLAEIVFNDPAALADLEAMVHPAVGKAVDARILASKQKIIFIEAIKLLEGNLRDICHQVWVTRCSPQRQLERLRVCRGMETEVAAVRIKGQASQEEKVAQSDVLIDTNGLMKDTEAQFEIAWARLPDPASAEPMNRLPLPDESAPVKPLTARPNSPRAGAPKATPQKSASEAPPPRLEPSDRPDDLQVRRARPSDIPSILLLIQKATDGKVKMKRAELLMALSERGYFIGQLGTEISAVLGYNIDSQVARVDEIYIHPLEMATQTGKAVLEDIEISAATHMGQIIVAFLPQDAPAVIRELFEAEHYAPMLFEEMAKGWQSAIEESQPEGTDYLVRLLRDTRAG
ncbi:MAG: dephospho-CoA kinase [Ardenticatenaceae bacterium]|nr:dephospho-CoA kinase [Anaerolineales bacterium]MCB8938986.1 dephospho-CoA kinase [Ardenticatenaceae bacterium]MCB8974742.1 dephospho-CoA kinase [Ardenticatenaceae bacterium]